MQKGKCMQNPACSVIVCQPRVDGNKPARNLVTRFFSSHVEPTCLSSANYNSRRLSPGLDNDGNNPLLYKIAHLQ